MESEEPDGPAEADPREEVTGHGFRRVLLPDDRDEVQGHEAPDLRMAPDDGTDAVEGHRFGGVLAPDDRNEDVTGHGRYPLTNTEDPDDVEGHGKRSSD